MKGARAAEWLPDVGTLCPRGKRGATRGPGPILRRFQARPREHPALPHRPVRLHGRSVTEGRAKDAAASMGCLLQCRAGCWSRRLGQRESPAVASSVVWCSLTSDAPVPMHPRRRRQPAGAEPERHFRRCGLPVPAGPDAERREAGRALRHTEAGRSGSQPCQRASPRSAARPIEVHSSRRNRRPAARGASANVGQSRKERMPTPCLGGSNPLGATPRS